MDTKKIIKKTGEFLIGSNDILYGQCPKCKHWVATSKDNILTRGIDGMTDCADYLGKEFAGDSKGVAKIVKQTGGKLLGAYLGPVIGMAGLSLIECPFCKYKAEVSISDQDITQNKIQAAIEELKLTIARTESDISATIAALRQASKLAPFLANESELYSELNEKIKDIKNRYICSFLEIDRQKRQVLVFTKNMDFFPDDYVILPIEEVPRNLFLPEHKQPQTGEIYLAHPYNPAFYVPAETYMEDMLKDQNEELLYIFRSLGAKSVYYEHCDITSSSNNQEHNQELGASGVVDGVPVSGSEKVAEESEAEFYKRCGIKKSVKSALVPNEYPHLPVDLVWYNYSNNWQREVKFRLTGQTENLEFETSISEFMSESSRKSLSEKLEIGNGTMGIDSSSIDAFKKASCKKVDATIKVEYYPLSEYKKSNVEVKTESLPLLPAETKHRKTLLYIGIGAAAIVVIVVLLFLLK